MNAKYLSLAMQLASEDNPHVKLEYVELMLTYARGGYAEACASGDLVVAKWWKEEAQELQLLKSVQRIRVRRDAVAEILTAPYDQAADVNPWYA